MIDLGGEVVLALKRVFRFKREALTGNARVGLTCNERMVKKARGPVDLFDFSLLKMTPLRDLVCPPNLWPERDDFGSDWQEA